MNDISEIYIMYVVFGMIVEKKYGIIRRYNNYNKWVFFFSWIKIRCNLFINKNFLFIIN